MRMPWHDRAGSFSTLKAAGLAVACAPALWIGVQAAFGWLGMRPITGAIHETGDWAVRLLLLTLLVSPLRRIAAWPRAILVRRHLGVAVCLYCCIHFLLYIIDQKYDLYRVASEIVLRFYLTIGFVALLGMIALAATSTDAAVRRLGAQRWNRLHLLIHPIALLSLLHFALQKKIDVTEPVLMTGLYVLLLGYRIMIKRDWPAGPLALIGLAVFGCIATVVIETAWYGLATGVSPMRIFWANLDFRYVIRPAWWVLAAGLTAALVAAVRSSGARPARTVRQTA